MIRKNVHFTDKQIAELEKLSKATGLPTAELIRRAIDEYLKRSMK
jgi:predicted DNA-binding protein